MQLFSAEATIVFKKYISFFAPENMKKPTSKVAYNRPKLLFLAQIQHKSLFLFHKNCSPRDLCIMTLFAVRTNCTVFLAVRNQQFQKYLVCGISHVFNNV